MGDEPYHLHKSEIDWDYLNKRAEKELILEELMKVKAEVEEIGH